jgi:hypothetical protein
VSLVPLPQPQPPFPTPVPAKPQLAEAKAIVAKYAAAFGDESRLASRLLRTESMEIVVRGAEVRVTSEAIKPPRLERIRAMQSAFEPVPPSQISAAARTIGADEHAWIVEDGNRRLTFDKDSGLLLRVVTLTPTLAGTIPQQTDFDDWRDAGGTRYPFHVTAAFVDPWIGAERRYTAVTLVGGLRR